MNHLRRMVSFLLVLVLCFGLIPGVSAAEVNTPGTDTQTEATETEETTPITVDTQPTEETPPETESESTEPPSADVPMEEPGLMDAIFTGASVMSIASTQNSIMLFDYADNGNYTTVLNSQVACAYKPNGSGTTRTAYIKNLGWHFARYGGVAYADDPLYCIEPWRSYAASTSGNSVDRGVTLDGSGSTTGSNVWYALPAARREAIGLILLYRRHHFDQLLQQTEHRWHQPNQDHRGRSKSLWLAVWNLLQFYLYHAGFGAAQYQHQRQDFRHRAYPRHLLCEGNRTYRQFHQCSVLLLQHQPTGGDCNRRCHGICQFHKQAEYRRREADEIHKHGCKPEWMADRAVYGC